MMTLFLKIDTRAATAHLRFTRGGGAKSTIPNSMFAGSADALSQRSGASSRNFHKM